MIERKPSEDCRLVERCDVMGGASIRAARRRFHSSWLPWMMFGLCFSQVGSLAQGQIADGRPRDRLGAGPSLLAAPSPSATEPPGLAASNRLDPNETEGAGRPSSASRGAADPHGTERQIDLLGSEQYRTRQVARQRLEELPLESLPVIRTVIRQVDPVIGLQLIDILSGLALHSDLRVSGMAMEILNANADQATSVGRAASNSLCAIADLLEDKAWQILTELGAYIGPQNFSINGRVTNTLGPPSLKIDEQFQGADQDYDWIRYLKSIKVVYLRGSKIPARAIEAMSHLKQLQAIKLRSVPLTPEQLLLFQDMHSLEHLGLSYMEVDDRFIPNILQLPISHSIRLYGTKVSPAGERQLVEQFDGLEIFRGAGGFLGISSVSRQAQVEQVTPDSAASRAGIQQGDIITAINDVAVETFEQLRSELGKYSAEEMVSVRLTRLVYPGTGGAPQRIEMTVKAILQEEVN